MNRQDLAVGQPVKVYGYASKAHHGEIVRIGRTLVTIKYGSMEDQFRIDTQQTNGAYTTPYFRTLDQAAAERRRWDAERDLRSHGLEIRLGYNHSLDTDTLEQVVAILKQPKAQP